MTIPIPLTVRIVTARQDTFITNRLADLSFRSTSPGGFASARLSLHAPLSFDPDELAHFARIYVYDARNGNVVWEGRLEDPGRSAGNNGPLYEISALGPATHVRDRTIPIIYVDTRLSALYTSNGSGRAYSVGTRESANVTDGALSISAAQGNVVTTLSLGAATYDVVFAAGQDLARVSFAWDAGFSSSNTQVQVTTANGLSALTLVQEADVSTSGGTLAGSLGGAPAIASGEDRLILRLRRSGATATVADDNYWAEFYNMAVLGTRLDAAGAAITSGYSSNTVLASEVVADLLGRLLTGYDGANASIATTSYAIEQLAYPDGVTAEKVLADLLELEPAYTWEAWESNSAGKYRVVWRAWPTTVRYEVDLDDGYAGVGSASDLYNAVRVRYRNSLGQIVNTRRTQTVAALDAAGLTREDFKDLGDEVSTEANAERVGDQFLSEHQYAPNAGRLTVARPVLDFVAGRMVMPWEIRPGHLIRVRGLSPRPDVLNATTRDGVTTFKLAAVDYSTSSASAELDLDSPAPSTVKQISEFLARPDARRR
jgi:hypothetical protein